MEMGLSGTLREWRGTVKSIEEGEELSVVFLKRTVRSIEEMLC